ncbi:hypothetical protein ACEPAG_3127 [Sanghuangporus baumii]
MMFIYEDGKSPPTGRRSRSNTFRTVDSVASSTRTIEQDYHNTLSPTSPTARWALSVVPESVQSPTSELRSKFCSLVVDDVSGPSKCEHASGSSIDSSNEMSQGQATGFESQTSQSMESSSMTCNSASSNIMLQTHATSEAVATTSASVSISGDTANLGTSKFSCSTSYAQEAGGSTHDSASVVATQGNNRNLPFALDDPGIFDVNLPFPLNLGSLDEELFKVLGSIAGAPTGLDSVPLQNEHESENVVEQDCDEYPAQQEGILQYIQSIYFPRFMLTTTNAYSFFRLASTDDDLWFIPG